MHGLISEGKSWYNSDMTIKKIKTVKMAPKPSEPSESAADGASAGGAAIADRFKLDLQDPAEKKSSSGGIAATIAGIAGFIALGVAGILTFVIYQHWEFLKGA